MKLCYGPKYIIISQRGPFPKFNIIPIFFKVLTTFHFSPKCSQIIVWPKNFKYFQKGLTSEFKIILIKIKDCKTFHLSPKHSKPQNTLSYKDKTFYFMKSN